MLALVLKARGVPLRYIQDLLGHSDLKMTIVFLHMPSDAINGITKMIEGHQGEA